MSRFRISATWPADALPMPAVPQAADVVLDLKGRTPTLRYREVGEAELPEDFAIRELLEPDFNDPQQMVRFVERYGIPHPSPERWPESLRAFAEQSSLHMEDANDVGTALSQLQFCGRHLVAVQGGEETAGLIAWEGWESPSDSDALGVFVDNLNRHLRPVHAVVIGEIELASGERVIHGPPRPGLVQAIAIQLFNIVVEQEVPIRTCPNCGTHFRRQRGRALKKQHRTTGVTYCSKACARAKANRDYRKRLKEKG